MRILVLHDRYRLPGGEERVVDMETRLLRQHGHQVDAFTADNAALTGPSDTVLAALRVVYSPAARRAVGDAIARFRPDVVHLHNFLPQLSPSVLDSCRGADVPVVLTLHNYRLVCPNGMLFRDGHLCDRCLHASALWSVRWGCYRGSHVATLPVATMVEVHRHLRTWQRHVDRFIALSRCQQRTFVRAGLDPRRITVKPNAVPDLSLAPEAEREAEGEAARGPADGLPYALFLGRLSAEKGIALLLHEWRDVPLRLVLAGDGPLAGQVAAAARERAAIITAGHVSPSEAARLLRGALFVVLPSICSESFPLVALEAYSAGVPVLASRIGGLAEIVDDTRTGLLFAPGTPGELARQATWLAEHPQACARMGRQARQAYTSTYTPEANYRRLMAIYEDVVRGAAATSSRPAAAA